MMDKVNVSSRNSEDNIMASLTSKERVKMAVAHQEPDRPPIQIYYTPEIEASLKDFFKGGSIEEAFDVDFRMVNCIGGPKRKEIVPGSDIVAYDDWGNGYSLMPNNTGGVYREVTDRALARLLTMDDVANYNWPTADDYDYSTIPDQIEAVKDYMICSGNAGIPDIINGMGRGRGMEQVLVDIAMEDEVGIAIIDKRVDMYYQMCKKSLEAANGKIDILYLGEDLGTQKGTTMSPACFDSFFRPRIEKFYKLAHDYGALAMMHSCGSTHRLQSRLIDMGLDILDSVQPEPVEMAPEDLKAEFGDKLTYCGMISTQHTLPHGSVEDCRAEARHRLDVIAKGGGYIFAPAHNIQPDTPLENILAIYEEATGKKFM